MIKIPISIFEGFVKNSFLEFISTEEINELYESLIQFEVDSFQKIAREDQPQNLYFAYNGEIQLKNRYYGFETGRVKSGQSIEFRTLLLRIPQWSYDWHSENSMSLLKIPWSKVSSILANYPVQVSYLTKLSQSTALQRLKRDLLTLNFSHEFIFSIISKMTLCSSQNFTSDLYQTHLFFTVVSGDCQIRYGPECFDKKQLALNTGDSFYVSKLSRSDELLVVLNNEARLFLLGTKEFEILKNDQEFERFDRLYQNHLPDRLMTKKEVASKHKGLELIDFGNPQFFSNRSNAISVGSAAIEDSFSTSLTAIINELFHQFGLDRSLNDLVSRDDLASLTDLEGSIDSINSMLARIGFQTKLIPSWKQHDLNPSRWYLSHMGKSAKLFKLAKNEDAKILNSHLGFFEKIPEANLIDKFGNSALIEISSFRQKVKSSPRVLRLRKIHYFLKDKKGSLFLLMFIGFWTYVLSLAFPLATQYLLDQVVQHGKVDRLPVLAIGLLFISGLSSYFDNMNLKLTTYLSGLLSLRIRSLIHTNIFAGNSHSWINQSRLVTRLTEVDLVASTYINQIVPFGVNAFLAILSLGIVYAYSPLISLMFFIALPLTCFAIFSNRYRIENLKKLSIKSKEQEFQSYSDAYTHYESANSLKINRLSRWSIEKAYRLSNISTKMTSYLNSSVQILQAFKSEILRIATFLLALGLYYKNQLTLGQVLALTMLAPRFGSIMQSAVNSFYQSLNVRASIEKINELLKYEAQAAVHPSSQKSVSMKEENKRNIFLNVKNLSYIEQSLNEKVLQGVNFSISTGQQMVILGSSASGKSELLKILSKQILNFSGTIEWGADEFNIGYMNSEFHLFSGSLSFNLTLDDKAPDINRLNKIITSLSFETEILGRPDGLNYQVNGTGFQLSPSEIKKIQIVRMLYLNPDVLIFDHMHEYFDAITENEIFKTVVSLSKDRVVIWSTNNFAVATKSSHVAYIESGKLVAFGQHRKMVEENPKYTDFYLRKLSIN